MSFNGSFSVSQTSDYTSIVLTDTSTGADTNLTDRQITLFKADGTTLTPINSSTSYIDWPLSDGNSITITGILAQDWSLNIQVNWISSSPLPPPSTYTEEQLETFTGNIENFLAGLSVQQSSNPNRISDNGYFYNKMKMWVLVDDAANCSNDGNQFAAQQAINAAYVFINNENVYFQ